MKNKWMQHLMKGALILSLSSLIAKILSAVYRVPFQNMVGNTGFYVYQQIYPIYGIGMTFALSGFPVFISKLIAEQDGMPAQREVTKRSFVLLAFFGVLIFGFLQIGAVPIAAMMSDVQLAPIIRSVSFMFLTMPFLATTRGYFQGTFNMVPTAVSQVTEQLIRVGVILVAAYLSIKVPWGVYKMGTWAMSGATFGAIGGTLVLARAFHKQFFYAPDSREVIHESWTRKFEVYGRLLKRFFIEGGSICLFASMIVLLQLVDSFTVKRGLVQSGVPENLAKGLKGIYDRGQPLVQLGLVISTAFSSALLPSLTHAYQQRRHYEFYRIAQEMVHTSSALSVAATSGLIALMPFINRLLFGDTSGNTALCMYMLSIILVALINSYNSVLQSQNEFRLTTVALFGGLLVKIIFNEWFVRHFGTTGSSFITALSLLAVFLIIYAKSSEPMKKALFEKGFIFKLLIICLIMSFVVGLTTSVFGFNPVTLGRLKAGVVTVFVAAIGAGTFIFLALRWHLFTIREWLSIPYGRRFLKWLSKRNQK